MGGLVQGFHLLGMAAREARMYLVLLDSSHVAREAAQLAGLHRATGYRVLWRLLDRGLVSGDGQIPQRYRAVEPSLLFHRLEMFYRDETEIPMLMAEAFGPRAETAARSHVPYAVQAEPPRILSGDGRGIHPALLEIAQAKQAVNVIARPLSAPLGYRTALARALGRLARRGIQIRLITDALPADYRFCRSVVREAGGVPYSLQMRHYSPLACNLYSIDRQKVIRLPTLGMSSRNAPVGVVIEDPTRVRQMVSRFEALWTDAVPTMRWRRAPPEAPKDDSRSDTVSLART